MAAFFIAQDKMQKEKKRFDSLMDFVVSDERRDWILRTYPPSDIGRPGILVVRDQRRKPDKEPDIESAKVLSFFCPNGVQGSPANCSLDASHGKSSKEGFLDFSLFPSLLGFEKRETA